MEVIWLVTLVIGAGWMLYALRLKIELRRWSHLIQTARIAVSFKRKVILQAPLSEWALWCRQLDEDKDYNGRVVFAGSQVRVVITKALPRKVTRDNRDKQPAREGKWQAHDQTVKNGA